MLSDLKCSFDRRLNRYHQKSISPISSSLGSSSSSSAAGAAITSGLTPTGYDLGLRSAYNDLRDDLIALVSDVSYINGRLVNLEANNT